MDVTVLIFTITYVAIGIGTLPGFRVDRTGSALLGDMLLIAAGRIGAQEAWDAVSFRTIGLLFGLMVVSSSFIVSGFYAWAAARLAMLKLAPPALLAVFVGVSALASSVLTNDVVVVAMTPLLVAITVSRGLNPVPFLLGFCFASNTGSAGTIIGSPQNMIIAQGLDLSFNGFLRVAAVPALVSLPIVWGTLSLLYRRRWTLARPTGPPAVPQALATNHWETAKAAIVTAAVVLAFIFTDWPREQVALAAAALLLLNHRISSTDMLKHVDGNLLLLLMGLYVVNAALARTGLPQGLLTDLRAEGVDLQQPMWLLLVASVLSNIVGNNPTAMLLVPYIHSGQPAAAGAAVALGTGFSSNAIVFGSLAGIIVVEAAARHGVKISFGEFARAGVPVALATMLLAAGWIWVLSSG